MAVQSPAPAPSQEQRENMYCRSPHVNVCSLSCCMFDVICRQIVHDHTRSKGNCTESEESRDDATAKNADEKAAHSIPSVRQTQCNICTFAVTHN